MKRLKRIHQTRSSAGKKPGWAHLRVYTHKGRIYWKIFDRQEQLTASGGRGYLTIQECEAAIGYVRDFLPAVRPRARVA